VDAVELTALTTNSNTCTRAGPCDDVDTTSPVTINLEPEWGDYSTCSGSTGSSCTGMVPSLVTAVCAAGGLTCTQSVTPWSSVWDGAIGTGFNDGSVQVAAGARFTVPRSDQCMAFSNPYTAASTGSVLATAAIGETPPASGTAVTFCSLKGWAIGTNYLNEAKGKQTEWNGGSRGVFSMNYIITVVEKETFADILTAHNNSDCHYSLVEPGGIAGGSLITVETVTEAHHRVGGVSFMADGAASNTKCIISKLNAGLGAVRRSGVLAGLAVGKTVDAVELTAHTGRYDETCTRG